MCRTSYNRLVRSAFLFGCLLFGLATKASAQCGMSVQASDSTICEKDVVVFEVKNKSSLTVSLVWDFGFKQVYDDDKPTVVYPKKGTYGVVLIASLSNNTKCTVEIDSVIRVKGLPEIGAVVPSVTELCGPGEQAQFNSTATNVQTWIWTIEGAEYETKKPLVRHTFDFSGFPLVQLMVKNSEGCGASKIFDSLLHIIDKPTVSFSSKRFAFCTVPASLDLKPIIDLKGASVREYLWKFEGATLTYDYTANPTTKYYNKPGAYDVELSIASQAGCQYKYEWHNMVEVSNIKQAKLTAVPITKLGCNTMKYKLKVTGVDTSLVNWSFNQKVIDYIDSTHIDSTIFAFIKEGTHPVSMVMQVGKCKIENTVKLEAKNGDVKAGFSLPKCYCQVPTVLSAKNLSTGPDSLKYSWRVMGKQGFNYQDDAVDLDMDITQEGSYIVVLRATAKNGCYDERKHSTNVKIIRLDSHEVQRIWCSVNVADYQLRAYCDVSDKDLRWYFFDSAGTWQSGPLTNGSTVTFPRLGKFHVAISAGNKGGCYDSLFLPNHVLVKNCFDSIGKRGFNSEKSCAGLIKMLFNSPYASQLLVNATLVNSQDTTIRYTGKYESPFIRFAVSKPGLYNLSLVVSTVDRAQSKEYYLKHKVLVNKLEVEGKIGKGSGCLPFKRVALSVKSVKRHTYWDNGSQDTLTYSWTAYPQNSTEIIDSLRSTAKLIIKKTGQVDVQLVVKDENGCAATWQGINEINTGPKADFNMPKGVCWGDTVHLVNSTKPLGTGYVWRSSRSTDRFSPSKTEVSPFLWANEDGKRTITLLVSDSNGCTDSISKKLELVDMELDFQVTDTTARCSPAAFQFIPAARNADWLEWDFGDGDVVKSTRIAPFTKVYDLIRLDSFANRFTVTLTAFHKKGCSQKVVKDSIIRVKGPWIKFSMDYPVGCSPLQTTFTYASKNLQRFYIDYGDNTGIDSGTLGTHVFTADTSLPFEVFRPYVVASDGKGCKVGYYLPDTIVAYNWPRANFKAVPSKACAYDQITLISTSSLAHTYRWSLPHTGITRGKDSAKLRLRAGIYGVKLLVRNAAGCADSIYKPGYLTVYERPTARMGYMDTVTCVGQQLMLKGSATGPAPMASYTWFIDYAHGEKDSANGQEVKISTRLPGKLTLSLVVQDQNGCKDTAYMDNQLHVYEDMPADVPDFDVISHINNQSIELRWKEANASYVASRMLFQLVDTDTQLVHVFGNTEIRHVHSPRPRQEREPYCYVLMDKDKCNRISYSEPHCAVLLHIDTTLKQVSRLSWSPYRGWDSVQSYSVMRRASGAYRLLATIPGTANMYIDSGFCDSAYTYQVIAHAYAHGVLSQSNEDNHRPEYVYQSQPLRVRLATVLHNQSVLVLWEKAAVYGQVSYVVDRKEQLRAGARAWKVLTDTLLQDNIALVNRYHYSYWIRTRDKCGYESPKSNMARTILLTADQLNTVVRLHWNPYRDWPLGVSQYQVEVRAPGQDKWEFMGTTSDTFFTDEDAYYKYERPFAYRVKAIEEAERPDTSQSNQCVVIPEASIFAPSAFTPGNDHMNELFGLRGWALDPDSVQKDAFVLEVYNRWGQRVYIGHDINAGWDGNFNGKPCPADQYVWLAQVRALNGTSYLLKGGVALIR